MKKWISLLLVCLIVLAAAPFAMADPEINEDSIVTIIKVKKYANVHVAASKDSAVLGWAPVGNTYKLLAAEGDYYKIQYTSSQVGYVLKSFSKVGKKGDIPSGSKIATITRVPDNGNGVNIRDKANSSTGAVLGVAHLGDKFEVTGKSGKWTKVIYNGNTAYIYTYYLTITGGGSSETITPIDNEKAYIDCNTKIKVRTKASSSGKKLGYLNRGEQVTVTGITSKWTRIKYGIGEGWVSSQYVSAVHPDADIAGKTATIVNCKYYVNVRTKASSSSKRLGTADKGDTFTIQGRSGSWIKVTYDSKPAFIHKKYVKIG